MSASPDLIPMQATGPLAGFRPMLDKEVGAWWGTRRWLIHLVLWPW